MYNGSLLDGDNYLRPTRVFSIAEFITSLTDHEDDFMHIWVDADACPGEIKELLFRAADRTKTKVTLVANQPLRTPFSEFIDSIRVEAGPDVADQRIVELVEPGDLAITADIPLAASVVEKRWRGTRPTRRALHESQRRRATGSQKSDGRTAWRW